MKLVGLQDLHLAFRRAANTEAEPEKQKEGAFDEEDVEDAAGIRASSLSSHVRCEPPLPVGSQSPRSRVSFCMVQI